MIGYSQRTEPRAACGSAMSSRPSTASPVAELVETWAPFYAASNEPTRLRDIARR